MRLHAQLGPTGCCGLCPLDHQAEVAFGKTIDIADGQVAGGGLRVQRVDGDFQPGNTACGTQGQFVGNHVHAGIVLAFANGAGGRGQRHIASRADLGHGHTPKLGGLKVDTRNQ